VGKNISTFAVMKLVTPGGGLAGYRPAIIARQEAYAR
jgi:hypothetical protein